MAELELEGVWGLGGMVSAFQTWNKSADLGPERDVGRAWLPPRVVRQAWLRLEHSKRRPAEASFWPKDPSCSVVEH